MLLRTRGLRLVRLFSALVATTLCGVALSGTASAAPAKAAALDCSIRILDPTQLYASYVYTLVEVNCNQAVSFIGGYVSLYRDGTHLGSVDIYQYNSPYVYKINMVACVPGNYHVMGYGFANLDGGAPDISKRVATTPIPITCT
jgi:hypothetical protein